VLDVDVLDVDVLDVDVLDVYGPLDVVLVDVGVL
jgi:hypothetical protein